MASESTRSKRAGEDTTLAFVLFTLVFGISAYFYNGYGWNQTARYDPIWTFVEPGPNQGTLRIDDFVWDPAEGLNTGDWAHNPDHSEHYYSNKAPGTTLLGIPVYYVLYHGERLLGLDPISVQGVLVNSYLVHLAVTVLPVALSALFFMGLMGQLGQTRTEALWLTLLLYTGTLMWPFSTMLWAHTTAAAFVVASLWCFVKGGTRWAFLAGLLAGLAVLTDYGALPFAAGLVIVAAAQATRRADAGAIVLGGLGPLLVFGAYHWILFGSPLTLASSHSQAEMIGDQDFLGLFASPTWSAILGLTFSPVRGLFFFMPALILAVAALRAPVRTEHRALAWLAFGNIAAVFLMNLSFNAWQGGTTTGARYQIVALPFYVLLIALLPRLRATNRALVALGLISVVNMAVIASISPMAPDALRGSPLFFVWAKLLGVLQIDFGLLPPPEPGGPLSRGSLHIYPTFLMRDWPIALTDPVLARYASFNLGERLFGLRGTASLLPFFAFAATLGAWAHRLSRPRLRDTAD